MITRDKIPGQVVGRIEFTDTCWIWRGTIAKNGYGVVKVGGRKGKLLYIHRIIAELAFGSLPPGLFVCHACDNRRCCCPEHLFLGLPAENNFDAKVKGRSRGPFLQGERNPAAKLKTEQVLEIRNLHSKGLSIKEISQKFGISKTMGWQIVKRKSWKSV